MDAEVHRKAFRVSDRPGRPSVAGCRRFLLRRVPGRGGPGIGDGGEAVPSIVGAGMGGTA